MWSSLDAYLVTSGVKQATGAARLVGFQQVRDSWYQSQVRKELASKLEEHDVFIRGCGRRRDEGKGGRTHHSKRRRDAQSHEPLWRPRWQVEVSADVMERLDRVEQSMEGSGRVGDQWRSSMETCSGHDANL
ncbi:hypothetical protein FNV43_RR21770 [Rhamnella rubrinervis]|uniref:Uncharacterized protein n=1 Tax=Rhamnella rubrinervis TaxID=2594499 RepID=A0A8K0DVR9_9ROSA|nr:hypothetical protein FNV43_RR21770 [Rhamnella rubrinervis]